MKRRKQSYEKWILGAWNRGRKLNIWAVAVVIPPSALLRDVGNKPSKKKNASNKPNTFAYIKKLYIPVQNLLNGTSRNNSVYFCS